MNSVSEPTAAPRAGSGGHKRRSRWFKGKFLVLFLAVATLLGGAALMVPQFQEKASAINDGRDITWDIGNGNAGASRYTSMIEAVQQRASQGSFLRDDTHRTRSTATNEYFTVDMSVSDQPPGSAGTSAPSQIRLQIRASDLFVVGWLNVNENIYNRIESGTPPFGRCPSGTTCEVGEPTQQNTPFNGSYLSLERNAGDRANIQLSPETARQAVRDLSRSASSSAQQARGIIVLIQAISEAARFRPIEELFRNTYTSGAVLPNPHILALENSWATMSEIGTRHVNNPNDEAIPTLMLANRNILDQLGVRHPSGVVSLVLGIALAIVLAPPVSP